MKKYMKSVERKLNLPRDVKQRVMADLESSVQSRLEAGRTVEQIKAELGEPVQVASELNEQMKEFAYVKSRLSAAISALSRHMRFVICLF